MESKHSPALQRATFAGILVTMGIVFGDIGTSPLYTISAIVGSRVITADLALGALSAVFWTLTFQTTIKYVLITLRADNHGEGGIFSLYALVRKMRRSLVIPAVIGGAFLLADGIITPPISVASAIEGLKIFDPTLQTEPIVIAILVLLFAMQQFGTERVGQLFGPVMIIWFSFIGIIGAVAMVHNPHILAALNPYYAIRMVTTEPNGFFILGGVFLCTTGAEALYSDLGHCGKANMRVSWVYVKICLILSYAGQCAWLLDHSGSALAADARPFFAIVPQPLLVFSIVLATGATIIASQALISGSYTLINEAMQLSLWFKTKVVFPTNIRGQIYIPRLNWSLMIGCIVVVLYFQESKRMESAYGLAITLTMLMTTVLITMYLIREKTSKILITLALIVFLSIELSFLFANSIKVLDGGWFSIAIGVVLAVVMYIIFRSKEIRSRLTEMVPLDVFVPVLENLSHDESVPKFATHLVYLTASPNPREIEQLAIDSIIRRAPKRADIYWFVNVNTTDEPYHTSYNVQVMDTKPSEARNVDVIFVRFNLGFRVEPRLNTMFRAVIEDMVKRGEIDIASRYRSLGRLNQTGDFRFVLFKRFLSNDNELPPGEKLVLDAYFVINSLAVSNQEYFGLDTSNVLVENVPLIVSAPPRVNIVRDEGPLLDLRRD